MKLYSKLNKVRVALQERDVKKSGKNKFAGFSYYELSDFLPTINKLCFENGIATKFSIDSEIAVLQIIDTETGDKEEFYSNVIPCAMPKSNPIQELGATHTYMRRFLMLMAFEITDGEAIDAVDNEAMIEEENLAKKQQELKEVCSANELSLKDVVEIYEITAETPYKKLDTVIKAIKLKAERGEKIL